MKFNKFIYIFLIILSACMYSYSGSALLYLLSGVSLCTLVFSGNISVAIITSALALGGCGIIAGNTSAVILFFLNGVLPGILLGIAYCKKLSLQYLSALPACCFVSGWAYTFFSYKAQNGTNMFEDALSLISQGLDASISQVAELYKEQFDVKTLELVSETMASAFETFKLFVPAVIIIYSCIMALLLVWLTGKGALRFGLGFGRSFSKIYAPGVVSLLVMICFAGAFLSKESSGFFSNLLAILLAYYILCGISLLDFYFRKILSFSSLRAVIYIFVFITGSIILPQFLWSALMFTGMLDIMFDFRKLRPLFIDFDSEK